jgi:hypothetical protein
MRTIRIPRWREAALDFGVMSLAGLAFEGLHRLHLLGQSVSGMVVDSVGVAACYALLMHFFRDKGSKAANGQS